MINGSEVNVWAEVTSKAQIKSEEVQPISCLVLCLCAACAILYFSHTHLSLPRLPSNHACLPFLSHSTTPFLLFFQNTKKLLTPSFTFYFIQNFVYNYFFLLFTHFLYSLLIGLCCLNIKVTKHCLFFAEIENIFLFKY